MLNDKIKEKNIDFEKKNTKVKKTIKMNSIL
jgi:hypothetical protein